MAQERTQALQNLIQTRFVIIVVLCLMSVDGMLSSCRSIASTYTTANFNTYQTGQALGERRSVIVSALSGSVGIQTTVQNFALTTRSLYSLESYTSAQFGISNEVELGGSLAFSLAGANNESLELDGSTGLRLFAKLCVTDSTTYPFAMSFILGGAIIDGSLSSSVDKNSIASVMRMVDLGIPMSIVLPSEGAFTFHPRVLIGSYSVRGTKAEGYPKFVDPFVQNPIPVVPQRRKFPTNTLSQRQESFYISNILAIPTLSIGCRSPMAEMLNVAFHTEITLAYLYGTWQASVGVGIIVVNGR